MTNSNSFLSSNNYKASDIKMCLFYLNKGDFSSVGNFLNYALKIRFVIVSAKTTHSGHEPSLN